MFLAIANCSYKDVMPMTSVDCNSHRCAVAIRAGMCIAAPVRTANNAAKVICWGVRNTLAASCRPSTGQAGS